MAKDKTEVGITGQPVPKPKTAIQQHKLEKKRRMEKHLGKNVGGFQYSSDVNPYLNPRSVREEVLVDYLLGEGFASDEKSAQAIASAMSEEWVQSIMEAPKLPTQPIDKTARPTQQRQSGPATGPGSEARPQQTRRQLMTSPQKPQIDKTARPTQQSGPAPQSSGGLTPMQRLQRRPDITIR